MYLIDLLKLLVTDSIDWILKINGEPGRGIDFPVFLGGRGSDIVGGGVCLKPSTYLTKELPCVRSPFPSQVMWPTEGSGWVGGGIAMH